MNLKEQKYALRWLESKERLHASNIENNRRLIDGNKSDMKDNAHIIFDLLDSCYILNKKMKKQSRETNLGSTSRAEIWNTVYLDNDYGNMLKSRKISSNLRDYERNYIRFHVGTNYRSAKYLSGDQFFRKII